MLMNASIKYFLFTTLTSVAAINASTAQIRVQDARENADVVSAIEEAAEAAADPRSILFPASVPGPYFPDESEILEAAEERLNLASGELAGSVEQAEDILAAEEEVLEIEDKSAYGTLNNTRGLPKNIWQPSDIEKVTKLLEALQLPSKSPVMDEIARKLLLSVTTAPMGVPLDIKSLTAEDENEEIPVISFDERLLKRFINLRTSKLIERGNLEDLVLFIQNMPVETLEANQKNAEILLLGGDLLGACQMANSRERAASSMSRQANNEDIFWSKMTVFCRIMEENESGAQIALDMLREQDQIDFVFLDLANKLMEEPSSRLAFMSAGLTELDPLNYTMLSLLDQPIDAQLIENSSPLIISAMVINPNIQAENRFQAAIKSNQSGGVATDVLKSIYDLQEFSQMEYQNAVRMAEFDERPLADVLLFQSSARQATDIDKSEILEAIWNRAALNNDLSRKAQLNSETLKSINPAPRLINHAHHISRGLLLAGEYDRAREWYDFVRRSAVGGNADATRALINIWPLFVLTDESNSVPWSEDILDLWWNGQMVLSPENRDSRATLFYVMAEASGHRVSEEKWAELVSNNQLDNAAAISYGVWREMIRAVGENKPAEAIILSLIAMGDQGPGRLDPSGIGTIVRILRSFGLEREARMVILESLIHHDF
ncbi:hypothetical protein N8742_07560 [Emcibacteraceae bacterium]|nr:hypothetical protein [Emcibacteraceae bacterium]MDA9553263.1 hypothetical protein [Emcibacteraceae bacterium]